jgi:hypothetical protein
MTTYPNILPIGNVGSTDWAAGDAVQVPQSGVSTITFKNGQQIQVAVDKSEALRRIRTARDNPTKPPPTWAAFPNVGTISSSVGICVENVILNGVTGT